MKKIKLGDVLEVKRGASLSGEHYADKGQYIRLTLGNFDYPGGGFKANTAKNNLYFTGPVKSEFILEKGDIITPLTEQVSGLLGETATIPESKKYIQSGDVGLVIPNEIKINKRFAYYLLSSPIVKKQLDAGAQQTKIRHTSPKTIKACTAWIPENINDQARIGKLLDDLNSAISNNNSIRSNLDDMAKLLYEYWFIQFDFPNNDKPYKSGGGELVYNNMLKQNIPDGWKVAKVKDVISHINTGLNPRQNFVLNNGDIKYITVKNLTTKGTIDFTTCDTINEEAFKKVHKRSDISKGDILFASIAPLGRCVIIREDPNGWDINESVFSIRPKSRNLSEYLYLFFMSEAFIKKAEQSSTGSVFSGIRISVLEDMKIIVPPDDILEKFNQTVSPILDLKYQNELENQKLKELRDFLLPLLLNAQVTISR